MARFWPIPPFPSSRSPPIPALMKQTFRTHLRPVGDKVYDIEDCRSTRLRYRQDSRRFLLYTLRLVEPDTGRERDVQVTGLLYAQKDKAEQAWRKLQATDPRQEIPERLADLRTRLVCSRARDAGAGIPLRPSATDPSPRDGWPTPELEPVLLGRFGPGDWRVEAWNVEPVRYREGGGLSCATRRKPETLRQGEEERKASTPRSTATKKGEQTYQALRALWSQASANGEGFTVVRPLAYLSDLRALILEEAPGTPLEEILLGDGDTTGAVRRVAQALAAFNQGDAPATTRRYLLADQVADLERARRLLGWACPHLRLEVESIIEGVLAGLEEVPLGPTHRDLKADHIFLDGDRTIFIDLDSLAKADPVLDPAYLLARLAAMPALFPIPRHGRARRRGSSPRSISPTSRERGRRGFPSTTPAHS